MKWDEKEEKILRELWIDPSVFISDIALVLLDRSKEAIKKKAYSMGLGNKLEKEPEIDREYYRKLMAVVEG